VSINVEKKKEEEMMEHKEDENLIQLTWQDFNCDLNSDCPPFSEIQEICNNFKERVIDVRPYMEISPYRVLESDNIKVIHELFRHMDVRTLPVVKNNDLAVVGVITRQDLF